MLSVVKFKLKPTSEQETEAQSWRPMLRAAGNYLLNDRQSTFADSFNEGPFCSLETKSEARPFACSVNKSASIGSPWRTGDPKRRRSNHQGDCCDIKTRKVKKGPSLKRGAYEMHSSYLTEMKQARPWYKKVNANVLQQHVKHQDDAFKNFFEGRAKFPKFKRTCDVDGFEFASGSVQFDEGSRQVKLPSLGWVGYFKSRDLGNDYKVKTAWLKFEADGLYIVANFDYPKMPDYPKKPPEELRTVNGIDRGVNKITASADGEVEPNPRIGKRFERRLEIRQRRLSRKKKGSKNRAKAGKRVARVHQKIKRVRDDFQWKLAKREAAKADVTGLEDLNIKGMMARCKPKQDDESGNYLKNGQAAKSALNKAIADAAWYGFELKLKHQAKKLGNWVVSVPARNSSLECAECGHTSKNNRPEQEKFICEKCGHHDDADVDAGMVIANRAKEQLEQELGIDTLAVVSRKVTPSRELTRTRKRENRTPLGLPSGPGNRTGEVEQLCLFRDLFGESPGIALGA